MFNRPDYPDVYTTRNITCVSCNENFVVTEGHQAEWRVSANLPNTVNLHYEDNRQQRTILPVPTRPPSNPEDRIGRGRPIDFTPYPINCPRCGADNRNWLRLQDESELSFFRQWQLWQRRYHKVFSTLLIAVVFAAIPLVLRPQLEISWLQAIVLALSIVVAPALFISDIAPKWKELRKDKYDAEIFPKSRRFEVNLWLRGLAWLLMATLVFPIIFFKIGPATIQKIVEFVDTSPEDEVQTVGDDIAVDFNEKVDQSINELNELAKGLGIAINNLPTNDLPQLERELEKISDELDSTALLTAGEISGAGQESVTRLQKELENEIAAIKQARVGAATRLRTNVVADVKYLGIWSFLVGLPLIAAIMVIIPAMKAFTASINKDLPPPVYYSVANMTRLASWEARQALEVRNNHYFEIQWMSVNRNEAGGLTLSGLFRDPPDFDAYGRATGKYVRAQRHTVITDKWCRIKDVKIEDVLVPMPAGAPGGQFTLAQQVPHDAPPSVRIRLPER
ncbi:MAG: hypothetical protein H6657_05905 [Ardenticatenaceae bacterium]|nr:hypothetical protein [Ardenticatenaceae bacterium]